MWPHVTVYIWTTCKLTNTIFGNQISNVYPTSAFCKLFFGARIFVYSFLWCFGQSTDFQRFTFNINASLLHCNQMWLHGCGCICTGWKSGGGEGGGRRYSVSWQRKGFHTSLGNNPPTRHLPCTEPILWPTATNLSDSGINNKWDIIKQSLGTTLQRHLMISSNQQSEHNRTSSVLEKLLSNSSPVLRYYALNSNWQSQKAGCETQCRILYCWAAKAACIECLTRYCFCALNVASFTKFFFNLNNTLTLWRKLVSSFEHLQLSSCNFRLSRRGD